jgi:hypothetical protein
MDCAEFLDRYTEFRDGLVTAPRELRRFRRHLAGCEHCGHYDTAVRRGVLALQAAETIEPSPDFRRRLEKRLARERLTTASALMPPRAGIAAALLIAAALAGLVIDSLHRARRVAAAPELPPVIFPKPVTHVGVPLVTFQDPRASVLGGNPNPYGTALVQPSGTEIDPAGSGR